MVKTYQFTIAGSASDGQTWTTTGTIDCEFHHSFEEAMLKTFDQLTHGRAVYGKPGVGCSGPYDIHRVVIEQIKH